MVWPIKLIHIPSAPNLELHSYLLRTFYEELISDDVPHAKPHVLFTLTTGARGPEARSDFSQPK